MWICGWLKRKRPQVYPVACSGATRCCYTAELTPSMLLCNVEKWGNHWCQHRTWRPMMTGTMMLVTIHLQAFWRALRSSAHLQQQLLAAILLLIDIRNALAGCLHATLWRGFFLLEATHPGVHNPRITLRLPWKQGWAYRTHACNLWQILVWIVKTRTPLVLTNQHQVACELTLLAFTR